MQAHSLDCQRRGIRAVCTWSRWQDLNLHFSDPNGALCQVELHLGVSPAVARGRWYQRRDSHPHWTVSETVASAVGLRWRGAGGGSCTPTAPGLKRLPLLLGYTGVAVRHLRIERSAGSLSGSPGSPTRHDAWCGARGSNSPRPVCGTGSVTRRRAPRGSGGGNRTPIARFKAAGPRRWTTPDRSLRAESNCLGRAYEARLPSRIAARVEPPEGIAPSISSVPKRRPAAWA